MQYVLPAAVFLLMVSVGMSLRLAEVIAHWRRLDWLAWSCLILATFIIPASLALMLAVLFHLTGPETLGLFMVGVSPGAPLLTRNLARKGFDMHMAASYQVWAALMIPIMIPVLVFVAGKLYGRTIWIPPRLLFVQILQKQFLPLAVGMVIAWLAPRPSERLQPTLNVLGNFLFLLLVVVVLIMTGSALKSVTPLVPLATALLAIGSILAVLLLRFGDPLTKQTFAVCNANRHVGLALLLTVQYLHATRTLPTVACYAVLAPLIMFLYVRRYPAVSKMAPSRK